MLNRKLGLSIGLKFFQFSMLCLLVLLLSSTMVFGDQGGNSRPKLKMITIDAASPGAIKKLLKMGVDITSVKKGDKVKNKIGLEVQTYKAEAVVSSSEIKKINREGFKWADLPGKGPVKKIGEPYEVYKSFDAPRNGIKAQLHKIQSTYPHIAQLKTIGYSIHDRPLLVMRLTNEKIKLDKPKVLFVATHHAREWVATQMAMRLIRYLASNYGRSGRVTDLLDTVEVWIMPVGNPDGYQYTFTNERLWRKNLRDNDGDGEITLADGVDLNRNFNSHWGYDNEGSSPDITDATYRGVSPESEPEAKALADFIRSGDFKFIASYHTYGNWLLYPWGWQYRTPSLDDPIFVAQSGTDANPAIWDSLENVGYDPGVGADLYTVNGDFTDWCYYDLGIPAQTVEFTINYDFRFPDDEEMVQTVFEDHLEFALAYAESALDPANPVSPVGIPTEDVYHTPLTQSAGVTQMVEVLARHGLDLSLCINGTCQPGSFEEQLGSIYNNKSGTYYSRYVAYISGQSAGQAVTYSIKWGEGTDKQLGPYSYIVLKDSGNPILVMAAEDYSGPYPTYPSGGPHYLDYYTDALDSLNYSYDVWDVDANGIPSYAEVLSHYSVVIWYTGDDYVPTVPSGLDTSEDEVMALRQFMNFGGKLLATGQDLAWWPLVYGAYNDDFFQYYLGANLHLEGAGMSFSGVPFNVIGEADDPVFGGIAFSLHGGDGANNQGYADSFVPTGHFYEHFDHQIAAWYNRTGIFEPYSGDYYVYSQQADSSFKRIGGTFTLPEGSPTLKFRTSYNIESDWDYAFVEIRVAGSDAWTTLPDVNGLTTTVTGDSCASGWVDQIHPFLAHYMDGGCNPTGTTGEWNALTGNSGGWQQVVIDLSAYAGQEVEIYISYATDWGTQELGVFIDDIELSGYPIEDFESGLGLWNVSTAPGSDTLNNWERIESFGLPEGPAIRTPNSLYLGFGFEAIDTQANREAVMDNIMKYFGL